MTSNLILTLEERIELPTHGLQSRSSTKLSYSSYLKVWVIQSITLACGNPKSNQGFPPLHIGLAYDSF